MGYCWPVKIQINTKTILQKYSYEYILDAKAVCLCFSLADRKSFENLDHWIDQLIKFDVPRDTMFLIGCKSDLDVQVATDQIIVYAQSKNVNYFQTSSYTG